MVGILIVLSRRDVVVVKYIWKGRITKVWAAHLVIYTCQVV